VPARTVASGPVAERPLVLVVEDNPDMNGFLVDVLGEHYRVESAFDGRSGLALARELAPDLVVTDVMMPAMSGDQMLRALRDDAAFDLLPVLVLTAKADEGLRIRLLRDGAQDLLVKPFAPAELLTRADNLIAVKRARDTIAVKLAERSTAAGELERAVARQRDELEQGFERLRRSESLLRIALAEKEVLLREIHHRVKNNLQIVASLLRLHDSGATGGVGANVLERCAERVRAMALLHETLYRRPDLARIDLGGYLEEVVDSLRRSYASRGGVRIETETEETVVDAETALPCGLILHELVVNALRHAFPDGVGTVRVRVERCHGGHSRVAVEDDGRGLPEEVDVERASTLGLQLVTSLAAQVGGRLEVIRGNGTAFRLELAA
jgi:two-component sensor histidine kinase